MSTYVPIQAITLSATASEVLFTGIPQTYTDLVIVINGSVSAGQPSIRLQLNSDTSTNYSYTRLTGNGTAAASQRGSTLAQAEIASAFGMTTTFETNLIIQIMNYSNITTNKTILTRANTASSGTEANVNLWRKTEAISSVRIYPSSSTFAANTTFTLYGVGSGAPKAFGGDEVRTDGTYWYHIFRSSGTFTPVQSINDVDFLVIAGGGGGGRGDTNNNGGGGGAGGYRTSAGTSGGGAAAQSKLNVTATAYTVTVGAGGNGGANTYTRGSNGSSSSFSTVSTTGGGGGGAVNASPTGQGQSGGSGGGSGDYNNAYTGGAGTANEGYDGGSGVGAQGTSRNMGGGGGAGAAGGSYVTQTGGAGVASSITGTSVTRAVGGNGSNAGGSGDANTGNGGSGNRNAAAGNGGSGIVVIRYSI